MKSSRIIHLVFQSFTSLIVFLLISETANALITQTCRPSFCYISPGVSKLRHHRSSKQVLLRSIQQCKDSSIPCDTANDGNEDRRSVLRKGTIGASTAFLIAAANIKAAEAKQPSAPTTTLSQNRRRTTTKNFPRVYPGLTIGNISSGQVCEIFVDLTCPYSRKTFHTISQLSHKYTDQMAFVYHNVIQPWHHQSLWLHESTFAVKILYPGLEYVYWKTLFEAAPRFYDKEIYGWTRGEFYDQIASFAANVVVSNNGLQKGDDDNGNTKISSIDNNVDTVKKQILQYLIPPLQPGGNFPDEAKILLGSAPDDDENAVFPLTQQIVKFQRKRGVHVTPTCFFNGIEQSEISSSWTVKEWNIFLGQALS
jgi:protein-disulfide isomerase